VDRVLGAVFLVLSIAAPAMSQDVAVQKIDAPDPVAPASPLGYTVVVSNTDLVNPSGAVTLTDLVPAGTTFVSGSTAGAPTFTCGTVPPFGGTGPIICTSPGIPPATNEVLTFTVLVNADAAGSISNTVTISAVGDGNPANDSFVVTTTVATATDLMVVKNDGPDPVGAGNVLVYTVDVSNLGPHTADGVVLADAIPANTTFLTGTADPDYTCSTPPPGGTGLISCTRNAPMLAGVVDNFVFQVTVDPAASGTVGNTAVVAAANNTDPNPGNDASTVTTTVITSADLGVTKADAPDPVAPNGILTYTVDITNNGPGVPAAVQLNDAVPANTTFLDGTPDPDYTCVTPPPGGTGTITCTRNTPMPAGLTETLTFRVTVDPGATGVISNTVTVSATDNNDAVPGNDSATVTTTIVTTADLSATKTDAPDPVPAGGTITYTATITNAGPDSAENVVVLDVLDPNTTFNAASVADPDYTCTTPAPGTTGTITCTRNTPMPSGAVDTFTLIVDVLATATGTVTNTISAQSSSDSNPANDSDAEPTAIVAQADLGVTKTDAPDPVTAGSNITYTITVTNAGPSAASNATLTDVVPAGTTFVSFTAPGGWTTTTPPSGGTGTVTATNPSLASGANEVFTLVVNVDPGTTGVVSNTATVSSATTDPNPANDSDTETTTAGASADLGVTKTDTPDPVTAGSNITYTITVTNAGPSTASNVTLTDVVPAGTTFVSFTAPGGWTTTTPPSGGTGTVTATNPSLAAGANEVFTLVVNVDPATTGVVNNTATISSATADPNPANDSATTPTAVGTAADLGVTKTDAPDPVTPGGNITYTITVTNAGPSSAANAQLSDTVPAGTTFVSLTAPAGWTLTTPPSGGTGTVTATNPSLASGANEVFTLVVNVNPATTGMVTNTATVSSATADGNTANDSATATTAVSASADLAIAKAAGAGPFTAGGNVDYTITVTNNGPSNATGVTVTDTLPAGASFVSATPSQGTCSGTGPVICNLGGILSSGTATIALVVQSPATAGTLTNTATVAGAEADPVAANNSASADATTTGGPPPAAIPTMSEWMLLLMAMALAGVAALKLRN
jgi:uncharacterized repeat protein (TIGR01451 family)